MDDKDRTIADLLLEVDRLKAELAKAGERTHELEDTRTAMIFMLEDLNESTACFVRSKKEWETTFDGIPDPLFIHDREFRIVKANRAYAEVAGLAFNEIIGRPYYEVFPKMEGPFGLCVTGQEPGASVGDVSLPYAGRVFNMRVFPIIGPEGNYIYSVHLLEDVTEKKLAELALRNEAAVTKALLTASGITCGYLNWDEVVEQILVLLHEFTDSRGVAVMMLDGYGVLRPMKAVGVPEDNLSFFYSMKAGVDEVPAFARVVETKNPLCVTSKEMGKLVPEHFAGALGLKEQIIAPIISRDKVEGLIAGNFERLPSDPRVLEIFKGIAGQLGVAYENSCLYEDSVKKGLDLARKVEALKVLSEIDRMILSTLKRDEMLSRAIFQIRRIVPADVGGVALVDQDAGGLNYRSGWGLGMQKDEAIPFEGCPGSACLRSGKALVRANLQDSRGQAGADREFIGTGARSDMYVPIVSKGEGVGLLFLGSRRVAGFSHEDVETAERFANQVAIALENTKLFSDLEDMFVNIVQALSSAIDAKSPWTKGHSERVTSYAVQIAERMGLGEAELEKLRLAGLLHDIGKIGTYDVILDKPSRLTDEEFALVKKHPDRGCEILSPIKQFRDILPVIRGHHERMDGSGYPDGLKGEEIPLMARILCVADSFDSMTADRPYRPAPGVGFAVSEFRRCCGTQFDSEVVDAFLEVLKEDAKTRG